MQAFGNKLAGKLKIGKMVIELLIKIVFFGFDQ